LTNKTSMLPRCLGILGALRNDTWSYCVSVRPATRAGRTTTEKGMT